MPIHGQEFPFSRAELAKAPHEFGVYTLLERGTPVYVGEARAPWTIQACLWAHFYGLREPAQATHFAWELHADPQRRRDELEHARSRD